MKRREILKGVSAAIATTVVPTSALAAGVAQVGVVLPKPKTGIMVKHVEFLLDMGNPANRGLDEPERITKVFDVYVDKADIEWPDGYDAFTSADMYYDLDLDEGGY